VSSSDAETAAALGVLTRARLVAEIVVSYGIVHWYLRRRDLPAVVAALRRPRATRRPLAADDRRLAGIAVRVLSVIPGDSRCLVRSLVVLRLLSRRGIDVQLIIAARPAPTFEAHAWVERAGRPLLPTRGFGDARLTEL
jgi:Transglutaminase-like superfamily